MSNKQEKHTVKRLTASVLAIIMLSVCLCITTYALVMVSVSVPEDNYFKTGSVGINLNNGKPVIEEHEFLFEPGMTVTRDFFIENQSTRDVYYKIYFDEVTGGLAKVLQITIMDGEMILYVGTADELSKVNVKAADDTLSMNEKRNLTISFHYPEEAGNSTQNMSLSFKLCAEAVQTKNNPDKLFD